VSGRIVLHGLGGAPGSRLARLLGDGLEPLTPLRGAKGGFERVVAAIGVEREEAELLSPQGDLPAGAAQPEGFAVRLRERGFEVAWGEPVAVASVPELLERCRERGRSSVALIVADPALASGMQIGSWFDAGWRLRALRALGRGGVGQVLLPLALRSPRWLAALADLAFWAGVRERADERLWRRLTRDSYTALVYHRFAGELKPGQERIDIAPRRFRRQLWALRLAGFRPLAAQDLIAFHAGDSPLLPPRRVAITVDDGMADCLEPLRRAAAWHPQLFVPTAELGGSAHWIDGEPVADWEQIVGLAAAGVGIGSHTRHHRRLTDLDPATCQIEIAGSLAELRQRLPAPLELLAYPNGDHDAAVCRETRAAGYAAAFTTEKGRNGAAADPFSLKRVSVHGADGALAILWKAWTGEGLPAPWLRLRGGFANPS
jgi:peptidoglycan/xylan/chitin deacetylase (PgdA/CDA1 family)